MTCLFCEISKGNVPSKKVFEDDKVFAILDIYPANLGHILLMPKEHYEKFTELTEELAGYLGVVANKLAHVLVANIKAEGVSVTIQEGPLAGQRSPHCVLHIIPRKDDDSFNMSVQGDNISQEDIERALQEMKDKKTKDSDLSDSGNNLNNDLSNDSGNDLSNSSGVDKNVLDSIGDVL